MPNVVTIAVILVASALGALAYQLVIRSNGPGWLAFWAGLGVALLASAIGPGLFS
jgi:hypothetical protein